MEKELLEMAELWKKTALEMIQKSEPASRSEFSNQMLMACAEMLEWKIKTVGGQQTPEESAPNSLAAFSDDHLR